MSQIREGLGGRIQQARLSARLTQEDLARVAGVSVRNIVRWENNQHSPRIDHLVAIAAATRVDVREFMGAGDDEEETPAPMVGRSLAGDLGQLARIAAVLERRPDVIEDILAAEAEA